MTFFRTTFWNGVAVSIRLITGLTLNKVLALLVGPSGYALLGQFQNTLQLLFTFSAGAINNGVTKFTTENEGDPATQARIWSTAMRIALVGSGTVAILLVLFHRPLSSYFLGSTRFQTVFLWLAGSIVLFSLNAMLLAILNGKKDLRAYVTSNVAGSLIMLGLTGGLTWFFGIYGALTAMAVNQGLIFFVTLQQCWRKPWFRREHFFAHFSGSSALQLLSFAVMAASSAIANNAGQVIVRVMLSGRFGLDFAGYWDAMIRISQINMLLVSTSMSFYLIPRIAELRFWEDIRHEIASGCKLILPIFAFGSVAAYLLRDWIVLLLFSSRFAPMESLFGWQLAGDTVRVASWFLAYVMISKSLVRAYVATEILSNALFVLLSWALTERFGFSGVAIAHFATYCLAIIGMFIAVDRSRRLPRRPKDDSDAPKPG
jgi:PST family polysaccharide transporter